MICDVCSDDHPEYWAWNRKIEDWVPMCEKCFDREKPDKWEPVENTYPYTYAWKNNAKRKTLYGRSLRVIQRMKGNSALVEFENGQQEVISRNAIRRVNEINNTTT